MKIWRLRVGPQRCSDGKSYCFAAWAYITGYWRWALYWWPARYAAGPRLTSWGNGRGHYQGSIRLPLVGKVGFHTQGPLPSMKRWRDAPRQESR